MRTVTRILVVALFVTLQLAVVAQLRADETISFNRDIRPILSANCIACHGPDEAHRAVGLRLDVRDDALDAIEPEFPEDSELFLRIASDDEDERMPPAEHAEALTDEEIDLIRRWIEQGAEYEIHWAFVTPEKPVVPETVHRGWVRNEIDSFVASKLEEFSLTPSADSEPHRLIRRLALDLTGLPPTQDQVNRFAENPTDEVYEEIVDELLSSPAYGEHWAAMWMDIARYADSMGYAEDKHRDIWPWRDWVIRAFNENMPYDQFTVEQLAGDLIPDATVDQRLATAFHRNTLNNTEGGTSNEEFRTIAVKDRISTTVNVWMGITLRCAECHTHKYDPVSQTEYYRFLDYFNQTVDADLNDDRPRLEVYPAGRDVEFAKLDARIESIQQEIAEATPIWSVLQPVATDSRDGSEFEILDDSSILPVGDVPDFDEYEFRFELPAGTHTGLRLEVIPDDRTDGNVGRAAEGSFVISRIQAIVGDNETRFSQAAADHSQVNYGIELAIREEVDDAGWAVNHPADGYRARREAVLTFETPVELATPQTLTLRILHKSPWAKTLVGRTRYSVTSVEQPAQKYKEKKLDPLRRSLENVIKQRNSPIRVPVLQEREEGQRRETFVNIRGNYMSHGEQVNAGVPEAFNAFPENAPANRLGVAMWLMSDDNPLTARVTVNRFWARLFGTGIVETEEDFGNQGTVPSNQQLLDWMAVDFRENGWDVKRLLKQIVTSSAYRQDNRATDEQLLKDPRNRYLARGPHFRLSAEVVRDQALAVSGLLSDKQFGPPVYPHNPVKFVRNAFTGGTHWRISEGEDRYRRAVYTYLKRSSPHPLFDTFDMASRTVCNMRRIRTNTPLQSFMTLNDEAFVEAARALAESMQNAADTPRERIAAGLQQALLHPAREDHLETLTALYEEVLADYQSDSAAAALMSGRNEADENKEELAAMTVVANVIMNLDEFLTR